MMALNILVHGGYYGGGFRRFVVGADAELRSGSCLSGNFGRGSFYGVGAVGAYAVYHFKAVCRSIYNIGNGTVSVSDQRFYAKAAFVAVKFIHRDGFKQGQNIFIKGFAYCRTNVFAQCFFEFRPCGKRIFQLNMFF